jgi:uncharacterized protein YeaO (DUF488 family)
MGPRIRRTRPARGQQRATRGVRIKRAYEAAAPGDGHRVLIDRLWPRGMSKQRGAVDEWAMDVAVSDELRRWFGHERERWTEFVARYRRELQSPAARRALEQLAERARRGGLTLVYAARDEEHNNAVVLRAELEAMLASAGATSSLSRSRGAPRRPRRSSRLARPRASRSVSR